MTKITTYYSVLAMIVVVQFVASVIGKSDAVQQSASVANDQKKLIALERRESELVRSLAAQTALLAPAHATEYIAIQQITTLQPSALIALR